jgi:DNA-binding response OmpR family regulator
MAKILIVEDDPSLVVALQRGFELEGHETELVTNGEAAMRATVEKAFDVMILDVMLPKKSGFDACQQLRQAGNQTPIIMLTARGQEVDKVAGLRLGADDYVAKPFSFMELIARVEALLRRINRKAAPTDCQPLVVTRYLR